MVCAVQFAQGVEHWNGGGKHLRPRSKPQLAPALRGATMDKGYILAHIRKLVQIFSCELLPYNTKLMHCFGEL